ncbi:hypothetical protein HML84_06515 [Alcanivorax sp. IO_7]|nr:hypothetical protein HML84_06515 [Alcanivorax sp. IO_7]
MPIDNNRGKPDPAVGAGAQQRAAQDRWQNSVRYSLIVSVDVPDENIDIYSVVENLIETAVEVSTEI